VLFGEKLLVLMFFSNKNLIFSEKSITFAPKKVIKVIKTWIF